MHVLDSCTWIYGVTQKCPPAVSILDRIIHQSGGPCVAVSAYIFNEVIAGIERSATDRAAMDEAQTRFSEIVHGNQRVKAPTQEQVQNIDLHYVRNLPHVQMMAATYGIQAKDVPIVYFAYQHAHENTAIYTSDEDFSNFQPHQHQLNCLSLEYIDCEGY